MTSLPLVILLFLLSGFEAHRDATINVGSVITATKTGPGAAWTSSSGRFAFGFYAVETKFSIGIWLVTNITTVIWTYDRDGELLPEGTKLQLTEDGLHIPSPAGDRPVSNITANSRTSPPTEQSSHQQSWKNPATSSSSTSTTRSCGRPSTTPLTRSSPASFSALEISSEAFFSYHRCRKQRHPFLYATRSDDDPTIVFIKIGSGEPQIPPPPPPMEIIHGVPTNKVLIQSVAVASASFFGFSAAAFFLYIIITRRSSYQKQCRNMEIGLAGVMAPRSFTYRKLVAATKNFTDPLGKGGYSTVFRGEIQLGDGKVIRIAVKRLEKLPWENERGFRTEMRAAGRAHHRNLVRLLGFCREGGKFLLIYELMSQGSLAGLIFEPNKAVARPIWKKRAGMAMDVAKGILYLHEGCEYTIIHGDIKPDNVFVGEDGTAKIGDLGLAKLMMPRQSEAYTRSRGTGMYKAPEWTQGAGDPITAKVDVYSYGVLLLELIACRKYLLKEEDVNDGVYFLSEWAYKCLMESTLERLLPDMEEEEVDKEELKKMVMVALWCVQKAPGNRKSMKEVVRMMGGKASIPVPPDDIL